MLWPQVKCGILHVNPMSARQSGQVDFSILPNPGDACLGGQDGEHFSGGLLLLKRLSQQDACMCQISCQQTALRLNAPQIRHPHWA